MISKLCAAGSDIGGTCAAGSDMYVIFRQEGRCDGHDMYRIMHMSHNIIYISREYQTISGSTGMEDDMYRNERLSPRAGSELIWRDHVLKCKVCAAVLCSRYGSANSLDKI